MSSQEKQLQIVRDVVLQADVNARYDLYFTNSRLAIIYMGKIDRYGNELFKIRSVPTTSSAVSPPLTYVDERTSQVKAVEEELSTMPLDQIMRLSKKNSDYTYDEIEEFQLFWGEEPEFAILSADYETEVGLNQEQFKQLLEFITGYETLSNKLVVSGNWKQLKEILNSVQDKKAGQQPTLKASEVTCITCGSKNKEGSLFCEQCGAKLPQ
ncbi:MAG TPA: zinc ribbon domain-containing protein [Candidatus Acidoferrales bacterium]|nr:zinc ribbon domain-containing protein [Candidatus Acidoferrales bacterium]